jgi:ferredoxin
VPPGNYAGLTADEVQRLRARRRSRGFLGFLGGGASRQSLVTYDEREPSAKFPLIHSQHLTTAAALDGRDYRGRDARCSEGPIPVHCRSCSCGTCWIGILGGAENTSPMEAREREKLAECGVVVEGAHPPMRLSCMTQAEGPVSIVIPPWNGLVGRVLPEVLA